MWSFRTVVEVYKDLLIKKTRNPRRTMYSPGIPCVTKKPAKPLKQAHVFAASEGMGRGEAKLRESPQANALMSRTGMRRMEKRKNGGLRLQCRGRST